MSSTEESGVLGERSEPAVNRALSMQSRASRLLALGFAGLMGVGALGWYYAHALERQGQARESAKAAVKSRAQGEMALPSLGRIDPPPALDNKPLDAASAPAAAELPLAPGGAGVNAAAPAPYCAPAAEKTPQQLAVARRLSGAAFARAGQSLPDVPQTGAVNEDAAPTTVAEGNALSALLKPSVIETARAQVLPTQRFLLPQGAFIDCTLETAIDSTLAGMTTCITATDTFGADGKVVLLERGTKLIGETRGQVQQGSSRIFVLWTQARTPTGVVIPLDSPGTDELGRSGLPGRVNRHFRDRFGAAILISMIDGAIQAKVQSQSSGGTVIYNPSATEDIGTEVLKSTANIAPTVTKSQGDRIQILVARDLDFRPVYRLQTTGGR